MAAANSTRVGAWMMTIDKPGVGWGGLCMPAHESPLHIGGEGASGGIRQRAKRRARCTRWPALRKARRRWGAKAAPNAGRGRRGGVADQLRSGRWRGDCGGVDAGAHPKPIQGEASGAPLGRVPVKGKAVLWGRTPARDKGAAGQRGHQQMLGKLMRRRPARGERATGSSSPIGRPGRVGVSPTRPGAKGKGFAILG